MSHNECPSCINFGFVVWRVKTIVHFTRWINNSCSLLFESIYLKQFFKLSYFYVSNHFRYYTMRGITWIVFGHAQIEYRNRSIFSHLSIEIIHWERRTISVRSSEDRRSWTNFGRLSSLLWHLPSFLWFIPIFWIKPTNAIIEHLTKCHNKAVKMLSKFVLECWTAK